MVEITVVVVAVVVVVEVVILMVVEGEEMVVVMVYGILPAPEVAMTLTLVSLMLKVREGKVRVVE